MADKNITKLAVDEDGNMVLTMPSKAVTKTPNETFNVSIPRGKEYDGYKFEVAADRVNFGKDGSVSVSFTAEEADSLEISRGDTTHTLDIGEFTDIFSAAKDDDWTKWYKLAVPQDAVCGTYSNSTRLKMPDSSDYAGKFTFIPSKFKREDGKDGKAVFSVPDTFTFSVGTKDGENVELSGDELYRAMKDGTYNARPQAWDKVDVPVEARIFTNEKNSHLVMPEGRLGGYSYYLPNAMIKASKNEGMLTLSLPPDLTIKATNSADKEMKEELSVSEFKKLVEGKGKNDYRTAFPAKKDEAEKRMTFEDELSL